MMNFTSTRVVVGILVLIGIGNAGILLQAYPWASPELGLTDPKKDLHPRQTATLPPVLTAHSRKVTHRFRISNDGTQDLTLRQPTVSCGCSHSSLEASKLRPGESTDLALTVSLPAAYFGTKDITATVASTSGKRWYFHLIVPAFPRAQVPQRIQLADRAFQADGRVLASSEFKVTVFGQNSRDLPLHVPRTASDSKDLKVTLGDHQDTRFDVAGAILYRRDYEARVDILSQIDHPTAFQWSVGEQAGVTSVDASMLPGVVVTPERAVVNAHATEFVTFGLRFDTEEFTASLDSWPGFLKPQNSEYKMNSDNSSVRFSVDANNVASPIAEKVVFQVYRSGRPWARVFGTVLCVHSK